MRVLLIHAIFPKHVWSLEKNMMRLGKKTVYPPLGLITAVALLPQDWEFKFVDRNVREITEAEWDWAEMVMMSAMIVQKKDLHEQIKEAKRRAIPVAIGGPYPSSLPEEAGSSGADYLVLDEGEMTIPMFLDSLEQGDTQGIYRSTEKPDITQSPIPRYDLINLDDYANLPIQLSRGCPFLCEFCDIITLYGRKPRIKTPEQMLKEFDSIYQLGWRGPVFVVDDNFIGNKRTIKQLLIVLKQWMAERSYPFTLITEASLDLAAETELMQLMVDCNFKYVFLGVETPDEESLVLTKKTQNIRAPLIQSVETIHRAGLATLAGLIIGFDGEKKGAGDRIVEFVDKAAIPMGFFGMLQAMPTTALWHRLKQENRLLDPSVEGTQSAPMNFVPTRPAKEIVQEYVNAYWQLYDPKGYLNRIFRHCMLLKIQQNSSIKNLSRQEFILRVKKLDWHILTFGVYIFWQHGFVSEARGDF
ncbi:MAG: B12-binding domain-containing radical SAM protein, partial [Gammaproteobacteria bacterium]